MYIIQSKHGTMINANMNVKNQLIRVLVKMVKCGILVNVIENVIKPVKLVII